MTDLNNQPDDYFKIQVVRCQNGKCGKVLGITHNANWGAFRDPLIKCMQCFNKEFSSTHENELNKLLESYMEKIKEIHTKSLSTDPKSDETCGNCGEPKIDHVGVDKAICALKKCRSCGVIKNDSSDDHVCEVLTE